MVTVLHSALNLMTLYQCIKFHQITFNTFEMLRAILFLELNKKGNNSLINCDRVTILAFCIFSDGLLSM